MLLSGVCAKFGLHRVQHTSTTLVRSSESIQLTRNTPFCWDMMWLFEIQK